MLEGSAAHRGLALLLVLMLVPLATPAQDHAAEVERLRGSARAISADGLVRDLAVGAAIQPRDRVETDRRSSIGLRYTDGTRFDLGERSSMRVDRYSREDRDPGLAATVTRGVFRFVTGLIARRRPAAMQVQLPVATIGIRGTQVMGEVTETSATVILLEPEDGAPGTAIEVFNAFGSVVVDQPGYGTEIPDASSPPSPARRMAVRNIQNLMRSLQAVQRVGPPRVP